jgi:formate--tetrahydrofolate ligase
MANLEMVARELGLGAADVIVWGDGAAKIRPEIAFAPGAPNGKLVLVSAISPTSAGEGKTTCAIGLTQAARTLGTRAACALRQPSLGPVFGIKGGGSGGGRCQLEPRERVNLHFTGDLHAVTAAHDLLAALVDDELYFGAPPRLDARQVTLRRVLDMNDRALRKLVIGLGGRAHGVPREDGFDITAASEVMAILCLARDYVDLKERLGAMLVGFAPDGAPVRARELGAAGAMAALLRDALLPNLVATTEGAPALVHGGPFANIAHGCSSLVATRLALARADVVFTEAGFGFDLGGEKFLDVKCRIGGVWPDALVLVATLRGLSLHGMENLQAHVDSARRFGLEPIVALNVRDGDGARDLDAALERIAALGVEAARTDAFARGGEGARELAERVLARTRSTRPEPHFLYSLDAQPREKIERVARDVYGASSVEYTPAARKQLERAIELGYGKVPVCIAKTHLSLSDDEKRPGRPRGFRLTVRELRIAAGAGFLVPLAGEIVTMPGLPRRPHALDIDLTADGRIIGLA